MGYSNDMFHYMFKPDLFTHVSLKTPVGLLEAFYVPTKKHTIRLLTEYYT